MNRPRVMSWAALLAGTVVLTAGRLVAVAEPLPRAPEPAREATRTRLIDEVRQSWNQPRAGGPQPEAAPAVPPSPAAAKLDGIVLPTVSFTRVPIGQVMTALAAASVQFDPAEGEAKGVNLVVLDPENRPPPVTIALRHSSLRRILDLVTRSVGYQYEVQADAVIVRPGGEVSPLETAFFPVTRATVLRLAGLPEPAAPKGGGGSRRPAAAGNAAGSAATWGGEAAAMKAFLQQAGANFDAVPGASLAYDGSAIIVTQSPHNLERIRTILARYRDVRQVEIEAKFMEVQDGVLEELGVNWSVTTRAGRLNAATRSAYVTQNRSLADAYVNRSSSQQGSIIRPEGTMIGSDGTTTTTPGLNLPIRNGPPQMPGTADLGAAAGPLIDIAGGLGEYDVNAVVRALAQHQGTDLLSAPKVTVLSGNPATITVAQEMRYPQSYGQTQSQVGTGNANGGGSAGVAITAGTPQEFTSRNVGVELRVTPTVEEDNHSISLDLNPRVTEFDGFVEFGGSSIAIAGGTTVTVPSGFYQPIFSVRDITTKVTIWDGATLVMGGLTREEVKQVHDKVPVLGDLPLLGGLFRSKSTSAQKRNLLIFVTARLVNPGGAPAPASSGVAALGARSEPAQGGR